MKTENKTSPAIITDKQGGHSKDEPARSGVAAGLRLQTILAPVDFSACSEHALDHAMAFATRFQAQVILLHVIESVVYPENYLNLPTVQDGVQASLAEAARARLDDQAKRLADSGIQVKTMTRLGRPFAEIADAARECAADLIILGTHGYTGLKHVLLGSTAERVVRHAPCPVLTVRAREHES